MTNKNFFAALQDLEKEKGIPQQIFIEALESALISACKKQYAGSVGTVEVKIKNEKESEAIDNEENKNQPELTNQENEIASSEKIDNNKIENESNDNEN